jgi:hypothetical protein
LLEICELEGVFIVPVIRVAIFAWELIKLNIKLCNSFLQLSCSELLGLRSLESIIVVTTNVQNEGLGILAHFDCLVNLHTDFFYFSGL